MAVPDSCEFRGQRMNKAAPDSSTWCIVSPHGNERQDFPPDLPLLVVLDAPTEVRSIVGFHPYITPTNDYGCSLFSPVHDKIKYSHLSKTKPRAVRRSSGAIK